MSPIPCPHCGTTIRQTRPDGLCAGCGNLLPRDRRPRPGPSVARELLGRFLELRSLTPDFREWSEERLARNPPRLVRLRRLIVLFRTFEIEWDPVSFQNGKFIHPEDPRYAPLFERLAAHLPEVLGPEPGIRIHQLPGVFSILLRYRQSVQDTLLFCSGVSAASGLYAYACVKVGELNRIVRENVAIIDNILVAVLCPESEVIAVEPLALDYRYVEDDDWQ